MATSVAAPLERQFGRIAGVTEMTSTSYLGSTSIALQFDLSRDIDGAARDVQAAINAARGYLPPALPNNPSYRKVNPADAPIMIVALTSDTLGRGQMYDAASSILQQKLSQLPGVGQVIVGGSSLPGVRVEMNPTALNQYGIALENVRSGLAATTQNRPKGQLGDGARASEIATNDQLLKAAEYAPVIVAYRSGRPVRLSDVARVEDSVEDVRTTGLANGRPAVLLVIFRQPGANIIDTVDRVRGLLPELQAAIPRAITMSVVMDRTQTIRASLHDVELTLVISVLLVTLVVFAFLRSLRATLIPAVAVPVSLVGTFGVMYLLGYSLDNLSLMALTIATGFVVDDAIVVLENVTRHRAAGLSPLEAALRGAREIGFTVLSISLSLVAVFMPILLMGGMVGRLFREFAVTLSAAIAISLVVSLTTTPMMCATLLARETDGEHGRLYRASERAFEWMRRRYETSLSWVLRHPRGVLAVTLLTVALNGYLFWVVPKGFFPQQDTGRLQGAIQAAQDISFQAMQAKLTEIVDIVGRDPAVENVVGFTGGQGNGPSTATNTARLFVMLKPLAERKVSADQVIARLRGRVAGVPGAPAFLQAVQDVRVGGRMGNAQYQYTLQGDDVRELDAWGPRVAERLRALPQLVDVSSDQQDRGRRVVAGDRPRHRVAARHHAPAHRRHALRRLRPAAGRDHVHAAQPVPRGDGGRAALLAAPRDAAGHLRAVRQGRHGAAQRVQPLRAHADRARGEPPGAVPVGDAVLQPRAGRRAGRRGDRDRGRGAPARPARRHPGQLPGHRADLPGLAGQPAAADRRRRSSRSTSSSACSTRATSTRSRSCPRCRRPAWARCWPCSPAAPS